MERRTVIADEETALDHIQDGMTIALGGFITAQHPMTLIRGLARRGVKDLTVIGSVSSGPGRGPAGGLRLRAPPW